LSRIQLEEAMPHEFDNPRQPAEDGHMEGRVTKLESYVIDIRERLPRIETRLDQAATKADLERAVATMIKWLVGTSLGSWALMITIMTFVMNYAAPPQGRFAKPEPMAAQGAPAQPSPIIITIPPGALQWQPAPEGAQQRKP
jgi:hypothetical protein